MANYNSGNNVNQWKNEVTYTLSSDGKEIELVTADGEGNKLPTTFSKASRTSMSAVEASILLSI